MIVVMRSYTPAALLIDLKKLGLPDLASVKVFLAVTLFKNAAISAGSAVRMSSKSSKSLPEMLTLLSNLGIPLTTSDPAEAADDMALAREWLEQA